MTDAAVQLARFAEYAGLIESLLRKSRQSMSSPLDQAAMALQNALGLGAKCNPESGKSPQTPESRGMGVSPMVSVLQHIFVVCENSHAAGEPKVDAYSRPIYRPLALHACIAACDLDRTTACDATVMSLHSACESAAQALERRATVPSQLMAAQGHHVAELAWWGLALFCAGRLLGRVMWTERAADVLLPLVSGQQKSGALLSTTASDNPETHWYHELVILHALAGYAVRAEDRLAAKAVQRATEFHLNETQPDHATTQPWGLFAFIWNPATQILADGLLHAVQTQHPDGPDPVTRLLLADTLVCLRAFMFGSQSTR